MFFMGIPSDQGDGGVFSAIFTGITQCTDLICQYDGEFLGDITIPLIETYEGSGIWNGETETWKATFQLDFFGTGFPGIMLENRRALNCYFFGVGDHAGQTVFSNGTSWLGPTCGTGGSGEAGYVSGDGIWGVMLYVYNLHDMELNKREEDPNMVGENVYRFANQKHGMNILVKYDPDEFPP